MNISACRPGPATLLRDIFLGIAGLVLAGSIATRLHRRTSFRGAVALITGGSRGLGLALARELADEGARLALVARRSEELDRAAADLRQRGAEVLTIVADAREQAQAEAAVRQTLDRYGAIDVLINNAGVITVGPLEEMTLDDFQDSIATHAMAPLFLMKEAVPTMKARGGGRIVNIASIGGKIAVPHLASYSLGKFALVGLSDAFRAELAKDGIYVTTVCPGLMRTGSHINAVFKGRHEAEFGWFSLAAGTPATSISAVRAARQIVRACRYGQPQLIITWQARLAVLGSAVFPNLTAHVLSLVCRLLPGPVHQPHDARPGRDCRSSFPPRIVTTLADQASGEYNEAQS